MNADTSRDLCPASRARHGYFVLQISTNGEGEPAAVSGVLENLTTGGRISFDSAAALTRTLEAWAGEVTRPRVLDDALPTLPTGAAQ